MSTYFKLHQNLKLEQRFSEAEVKSTFKYINKICYQ